MFVTMEDKKKFICNFEFNSKTVRFFCASLCDPFLSTG